jgi:uncharacterized membrane protein
MTTETSPKGREDWVVALSLLECMMFIVLLVLLVGGAGVGAGYYLGSHPRNNQLNAVIGLAQSLETAHENERTAIKANYDIIMLRLEKYETFLLGAGIEPTLPLATRPQAQQASVKVPAKQQRARGGP